MNNLRQNLGFLYYFLFLHCISLFCTVFRKNCTALYSQSELRNFFIYIIKTDIEGFNSLFLLLTVLTTSVQITIAFVDSILINYADMKRLLVKSVDQNFQLI